MSKNTDPTVLEHNAETGQIVERPMTEAEIAQVQLDIADNKARELEAAAKAQAKTDLLAKLGITAEEAALLLS
jgi:hypothetical protein